MNDEEFLGYVRAHSTTERALFCRDMIVRLYDLAGREPPRMDAGEWISFRGYNGAHELVDEATARLRMAAG